MSLDDKDLFAAICARYSDQTIEFIMEQYEKAKRINMGIEQRLSNPQPAQPVVETETEVQVEAAVEEPSAPHKKKYTKRSLKIAPESAITDDLIYCCLCEASGQSLTAKHLEKHGITVEEYKKLCGYPADQKLMSKNHLEKSREIIKRAQAKRMANRQDNKTA